MRSQARYTYDLASCQRLGQSQAGSISLTACNYLRHRFTVKQRIGKCLSATSPALDRVTLGEPGYARWGHLSMTLSHMGGTASRCRLAHR